LWMAVARQPEGTQPDGLDRDVRQNPAKELRGPLDGYLDVLHYALAGRAAVSLLDAVGYVEPLILGDQLPLTAAARVAPRPEPADPRVLRAERPRAPEPVGVPPPQ